MGVCLTKQNSKKQLASVKQSIRSEPYITPTLKNKESVSRPRTVPTLPNMTKERIPTNRTQITQRTRTRIIKENLYKQYSVLNAQFGYTNFDQCGKLQHNVTGQVRIAITIEKNNPNIENFDQFITNITDNNMTSPHIALISELFQDSKNYYAIQQYCSGGILQGLCGKINEEEALYIASQILDALSNIHKQESCHGNLTIKCFALFDESPSHYVKLIDVLPLFQIKDKNDILQLQIADIKAVGLIIFQLITNKQITPQSAEMIIKRPRDLPTKTEWYQLVVQLLECKNLKIYEKILHNKQYCSIVQRMQSRYVETILRKGSKKASQLQEKILLLMNQQFFSDRQKQVESIFKKNDTNNNGSLSKYELKNALGEEDEIDELFDMIDDDGNGEIDFNEFIFHSCDRRALLTEFNLDAMFQQLQKKGFVYASAISKMIDCNEEQIEKEMNEIDNTNKLNKEQFVKLMMKLL